MKLSKYILIDEKVKFIPYTSKLVELCTISDDTQYSNDIQYSNYQISNR